MGEKRRNITSTSALIQCLKLAPQKKTVPCFKKAGAKLTEQTAVLYIHQGGFRKAQIWAVFSSTDETKHPPPSPEACLGIPCAGTIGAARTFSHPAKGDGNPRPPLLNFKESVGKFLVHVQQEIRKSDKQSRTGAAQLSE